LPIKAFELFGTVEVKNTASAELRRVDRDVDRTKKNLGGLKGALSGALHLPNGALSGVQGALGTLGNISEAISAIPVAGKLITGAVSAIAGPIKDLAQSGLAFNDLKENATLAFSVILRDGEKAKKLFADLSQFGKDSPIFKTADLVRYAQTFLPITGAGPELFKTLKGIGALTASTGDMGNLPEVMRALRQIATKPKLSAEEMNQQLADAGIDGWGLLGRARGQTAAEVMALTSQGRISGPGAFKVMVDQALRENGVLVDLMGGTRTGLQARIDDEMEQTAAAGTVNLHGTWKQGQQRVLAGLQGGKGQALAGQINTAAGVIGPAVMGGFDSLLDGTLLTKAQSAAQNVAGTVAGTVREGAGQFAGAMKSYGEAGYKAFTDFWEIKSPSERARRLGVFLGMGLEAGLAEKGDAYGALLSLDGLANGRGGRLGADRRAENEALLEDPRVQALMDVIGKGEGTFDPKTGKRTYNKIFGGKRVALGKEHPGIYVPFGKTTSSAAGFGQFLEKTWKGVDGVFGGGLDFNNPHDQELAVVELMRQRGMIGPLMQGDTATAIKKGGKEWASLPGSPYGQPTQSLSGALSTFNTRLGVHANGAPVSNANPMPVALMGGKAGVGTGATGEMGLAASLGDLRGGFGVFSPGVMAGGATGAMDAKAAITLPTGTLRPGTLTDMALAADDAAKGVGKLGEGAELTAEQLKKNREISDIPGAQKAKKDKLFDSVLTKEGVAGDFKSNLQGALMNPFSKKSWAGAGMGFLQDIQGRAAADLSSMLTGALFGKRGEDGKLSGGLLSGLFGSLFGGGGKQGGGGFLSGLLGSLFGGFRAAGGPVSPGRLYMVGENGPELFAPGAGGHVIPNGGAGSMGGGEVRVINVHDSRHVERIVENYMNSPRGGRTFVNRMRYHSGAVSQTVHR
jgi:muramidase (phage lysozyme)